MKIRRAAAVAGAALALALGLGACAASRPTVAKCDSQVEGMMKIQASNGQEMDPYDDIPKASACRGLSKNQRQIAYFNATDWERTLPY